MHVLSANQFSPEEMMDVFALTDQLRDQIQTPKGRHHLADRHRGEQIGSVFYEPSTRTKASFELAALKLGMSVFETENASEFSSVAKGETIEDTVRVLGSYGLSAIVIRTKEEGLAAKAASVNKVPIINGGDGKGEHPTQALLDAYTIWKHFGRLDNLKVVMGGDLARGRTVRSLSQLLAKFDNNFVTFTSIPALQIGDDIKTVLGPDRHTETSDMYEGLHNADVVYWTRLQSERPKGYKTGGKLASNDSETELQHQLDIFEGKFVIDAIALEAMPENTIILHPLPRVDEIHTEVDSDPRAKYFEQAENGLYVRMALLDRVAHLRQ